jgi:hypothetical protein
LVFVDRERATQLKADGDTRAAPDSRTPPGSVGWPIPSNRDMQLTHGDRDDETPQVAALRAIATGGIGDEET